MPKSMYTPPNLAKYKNKLKKTGDKFSRSKPTGAVSDTFHNVEEGKEEYKKAKIKPTFTEREVLRESKEKGVDASAASGGYRFKRQKLKRIRRLYDKEIKGGDKKKATQLANQYNSLLKELKEYTKKNYKNIIKSGAIERKYKGKIKQAMDIDDFLRREGNE